MTLIDELVAKHGWESDALYKIPGREFNAALRSALEEMLERCAQVCDERAKQADANDYEYSGDCSAGALESAATAIRALAKEGK